MEGKSMPRLVIIDDEPVLRLTFRHMLEEEGFQVWTAENGRIGQAVCKDVRPDLVITDLAMPEQDGYTTIRALHRDYPDLPIIAMSAVAASPGRMKTLDLGVTCCITKPVDGDSLVRLVHGLLKERDAVRAAS